MTVQCSESAQQGSLSITPLSHLAELCNITRLVLLLLVVVVSYSTSPTVLHVCLLMF